MGVNKAYDILLNPFDGFSAVATLQKQTRTIPADRNYQWFDLELVNCAPADIVGIFIRPNGILTQQYSSGTDTDLINQREGLPPAGALAGTYTNPVLRLDQRRDRLFGGALQYIDGQGKLVSGSAKDLETNVSLNCGSQDPNTKFAINTLTMEIWLQNAGSFGGNKPLINLTAYGYDPFPGGPGLMRFIDTKQFNFSSGQFTMDKDTAFTIGDGQRLNLDQVLVMNPNNIDFTNFQIYWQSQIIRNRNANINAFTALWSTLKQQISGIQSFFDSRELLYGDETMPIGALNSSFKIQGTNPGGAVSLQFYQMSSGMLVPTNPGVVTASPV